LNGDAFRKHVDDIVIPPEYHGKPMNLSRGRRRIAIGLAKKAASDPQLSEYDRVVLIVCCLVGFNNASFTDWDVVRAIEDPSIMNVAREIVAKASR